MLDWSTAAQAQLVGGNVRPAFFLLLRSEPKIRVWSGIGEFSLDADNIETEGGEYLGFGELQNLPSLKQLINGKADRVDFVLAGAAVNRDVVRLASEEAASVRNKMLHLGVLVLGADLQPISPVAWLWHGEADTITCQRDGPGDSAVRSITLSAGSLFTRRRRPGISFWTDHDQRERSSDDAFCDRVAVYSAGTTKTWPM